MKRLTKRPIEGEEAFLSCERCGKESIVECRSQEDCTQTAVDRLADIEDILGDAYDLDRLRELVKADREGRCVVLPCKVGDKVFQQNGVDIFESRVKKIIYDCGHFAFDEETIGEKVFLTRESAEAALKGEQA